MRYPCLSMLLCIALLSSFALGGASGYHLGSTYKLGGDGGWDYLTIDSATRHFYIARGTHVLVIDADSGKPIGDIPDTPGVHGIALAPELGRGFTSNGREGTVTIFDLGIAQTNRESESRRESRRHHLRSCHQTGVYLQRTQPGFDRN